MRELFPDPAGPIIPITIAFPELLNIFLIRFLALLGSFSTNEIAFAIALRLPFFSSVVMSNYLLFLCPTIKCCRQSHSLLKIIGGEDSSGA